jgi:hypothetical protein
MNNPIEKESFLNRKISEELKECGKAFEDKTHTIKITYESDRWMTVQVRNRVTHEIDFSASIMKHKKGEEYSKNFVYLFMISYNNDRLQLLGVPA